MASLLSIKKFPVVWLWLVVVFLASGLIINCVQLLLLPLWLINKDLFRWLNLNVVYLHWCRKYRIIYVELLIICEALCVENAMMNPRTSPIPQYYYNP